ncbi:NAD(P)-dependent oxidoreductase [Methyloversatilis sp.]|uniref:NAD-dependent epimerase/dehydratase family protein n=1 Tax=Methyloversatilis sp. TaxID=2569862 RepID=UPI0027BA3CBA|nr:NAD-dependent epimerase/dehydratase family protein [Methyloversatilis sp.]
MPTVALTGATGFIGGVLLRHLVAQGVQVRALSRQRSEPADGVTWIAGSLEDEASLARLVTGADAVIHCAGAVRGATEEAFVRTNVDGSRRLMAAARGSAQCKRFLLISSLAARHPELSWYAASKREAERQLIDLAGDLPLTVFRPTAVYGPGDRELRPLFEWLLRGWLFIPGSASARVSFLHVDDLAAAVASWLALPDPVSGVYELHDGRPGGYDWPAIADAAEQVRHRPVRRISIPPVLLAALAHCNLALSRLFGGAPMLTPAKLGELRHPDWSCNNSALEGVIPWTPRLQLMQALQQRRF